MLLFHSFSAKMWKCVFNYSVFGFFCPRSFSYGLVCRHDSLRAASQSEGVLPAAVRTAHL